MCVCARARAYYYIIHRRTRKIKAIAAKRVSIIDLIKILIDTLAIEKLWVIIGRATFVNYINPSHANRNLIEFELLVRCND